MVDALDKPLDFDDSDDYMVFPSNHSLNDSFGSEKVKPITRSNSQNNVFLHQSSAQPKKEAMHHNR